MIPVRQALETILQDVHPLPPERVSILDACGRVIAEAVAAPRHIPPRDNSAMDGYAVRRADLGGGALRVVESIPAGREGSRPLAAGEAMKIMTGAPVPDGADTVVPVEDTRAEGDRVEILAAPAVGSHIREAGEDVREGEEVIPIGSRVRPAEVGMLASLGRSFVLVHQRPRVAILATGDEIVEVDASTDGDKIINSNSYGLSAQVAGEGAVPVLLGIGRDDPEGLAEMLRRASRCDVVLTTGGVSMGDYDFVRPVLAASGVEVKFWKVAMRPGRPIVYGTRGSVPFFGLPGNPVSALVGFEQFVRPVLRRLQGHRRLFRPMVEAVLGEEAGAVRAGAGRMDFVRCRVERDGGGYRVVSVKKQGSGMLKTLVEANALMVLPPESTGVTPGDRVRVQIYDEEFLQGEEPGLPVPGGPGA